MPFRQEKIIQIKNVNIIVLNWGEILLRNLVVCHNHFGQNVFLNQNKFRKKVLWQGKYTQSQNKIISRNCKRTHWINKTWKWFRWVRNIILGNYTVCQNISSIVIIYLGNAVTHFTWFKCSAFFTPNHILVAFSKKGINYINVKHWERNNAERA